MMKDQIRQVTTGLPQSSPQMVPGQPPQMTIQPINLMSCPLPFSQKTPGQREIAFLGMFENQAHTSYKQCSEQAEVQKITIGVVEKETA
jgi:hypothetical protein